MIYRRLKLNPLKEELWIPDKNNPKDIRMLKFVIKEQGIVDLAYLFYALTLHDDFNLLNYVAELYKNKIYPIWYGIVRDIAINDKMMGIRVTILMMVFDIVNQILSKKMFFKMKDVYPKDLNKHLEKSFGFDTKHVIFKLKVASNNFRNKWWKDIKKDKVEVLDSLINSLAKKALKPAKKCPSLDLFLLNQEVLSKKWSRIDLVQFWIKIAKLLEKIEVTNGKRLVVYLDMMNSIEHSTGNLMTHSGFSGEFLKMLNFKFKVTKVEEFLPKIDPDLRGIFIKYIKNRDRWM